MSASPPKLVGRQRGCTRLGDLLNGLRRGGSAGDDSALGAEQAAVIEDALALLMVRRARTRLPAEDHACARAA